MLSCVCKALWDVEKVLLRRTKSAPDNEPVSQKMLMSAIIKRHPHMDEAPRSRRSPKDIPLLGPDLVAMRHASCCNSLAEPYALCSTQAFDKPVPKAGNLGDLSKRSLPILRPVGRTVSKDEGVTHQVSDAAERYRLAFFAHGPAAPALARGTSTAAFAVIGQFRNCQSSCHPCSEGCGYLHLDNSRHVLLPQHLLDLLRQDPAASRL